MKRLLPLLLVLTLLAFTPAVTAETATEDLSAAAAAETADASQEASEYPVITADIVDINKYGNLILSISSDALASQGFELLDMLTVSIAGQELDLPYVENYTDVVNGGYLCIVDQDKKTGDFQVCLARCMSDMATSLGIAEKEDTEGDLGYQWEYLVPTPLEVTISMKEKGGYAGHFTSVNLVRTNNREDYPNLTDEEYANFRNITTTGMTPLSLYRSSSPVDPQLNRNHEADEALNNAGVQTVINLTDNDTILHNYADYPSSYYSQRNVIALNMDLVFDGASFMAKLAEGMRYMATHEGPYMVHCTEGKDRCGFVSALLECLMGASAEEVRNDYMVTFHNFFGVEPGDDRYDTIANQFMETLLGSALKVDDVWHADLQKAADEYLLATGLDEGTIEAVKNNLATDWAH